MGASMSTFRAGTSNLLLAGEKYALIITNC